MDLGLSSLHLALSVNTILPNIRASYYSSYITSSLPSLLKMFLVNMHFFLSIYAQEKLLLFFLLASIFSPSTFAFHITLHISKPAKSKKNETLYDREVY